jgi:hypothetical protein
MSIGFLQAAFDASEEVEVMIYTSGRGQLGLFDISSGVPFPGTLRPLLVTLVTGQRASPRGATRTAIFRSTRVAKDCQPPCWPDVSRASRRAGDMCDGGWHVNKEDHRCHHRREMLKRTRCCIVRSTRSRQPSRITRLGDTGVHGMVLERNVYPNFQGHARQ